MLLRFIFRGAIFGVHVEVHEAKAVPEYVSYERPSRPECKVDASVCQASPEGRCFAFRIARGDVSLRNNDVIETFDNADKRNGVRNVSFTRFELVTRTVPENLLFRDMAV